MSCFWKLSEEWNLTAHKSPQDLVLLSPQGTDLDFCPVFSFVSSGAQTNAVLEQIMCIIPSCGEKTMKQAHISFHCQNHLEILAMQDTFFMLSGSCSAAYLKKTWWPHSSSWQTYSRSQSFQIIIAHKTSSSESSIISLSSTFPTRLWHFFWRKTANLVSWKPWPDEEPIKFMA